jgi:hypothetical protein
MDGTGEGFFALDVAVADQRDQRVLKTEGALLLRHGDFLMQVLEVAAANVVAGAVADHEQLGGWNAAAAFFG